MAVQVDMGQNFLPQNKYANFICNYLSKMGPGHLFVCCVMWVKCILRVKKGLGSCDIIHTFFITILQERAFENIIEKGGNAGYQHFFPFLFLLCFVCFILLGL